MTIFGNLILECHSPMENKNEITFHISTFFDYGSWTLNMEFAKKLTTFDGSRIHKKGSTKFHPDQIHFVLIGDKR